MIESTAMSENFYPKSERLNDDQALLLNDVIDWARTHQDSLLELKRQSDLGVPSSVTNELVYTIALAASECQHAKHAAIRAGVNIDIVNREVSKYF